MDFNSIHVEENGVTWVGFKAVEYCRIYWLLDGERQCKTICYDADEMSDAVNNRTKLTEGLQFEIKYMVGDISEKEDEKRFESA